MNIGNICDLEVDGVDVTDYPDFSDAYFSSGVWKDTGVKLTESELEILTDEYPELVNLSAFEHYN